MSIAIISASHYTGSGNGSISLRAAGLLKNQLELSHPSRSVEIFDLRKYGVQPCIMCGDCTQIPRCSRDAPFNDLLDAIRGFDELAFIVPHYAGLPSRLVIMLEKIQEMFWLRYSRDADTREIIKAQRAGICAHGGQTEGFEDQYNQSLIKPLTYCLQALGIHVLNERLPVPICFGAIGYENVEGQQFPQSQHDLAAVGRAVSKLAALFDQD